MPSKVTAEPIHVPSPRRDPVVEIRSSHARSAAFDRLWHEIGPAEEDPPDRRLRTLDW